MVEKRNFVFGIAVLLMVLLVIIPSFAKSSGEKVSREVYGQLEKNESVRVVVHYNEKAEGDIKAKSSKLMNSGKSLVAKLNADEIEKLEKDSNVRDVVLDYAIRPLLQDSVPIIGANSTQKLQLSSFNLTGINQTICVIDTGVNYSHADLGGCYGNNDVSSSCKVIGGYDYGSGDGDPMDHDGHGTHVSGIVAAKGNITGVAPDAKLVVIKVFDDYGSGYSSDIVRGIDWCVENSSKYNINVITISLGVVDIYNNAILTNDYCDSDSDYSDFRDAINAAVAKNISVTIATGNDYSTTAIGVPACIQNATRVGATTKADVMASYTNRNALVKLLAPGGDGTASGGINSTWYNGRYYGDSGTSMATPHVAGVIALLNQYLNLTSTTKTPGEIETLLNNTGKIIDDGASSGRNYSRINVYDALKEISFGTISTSPGNGLVTKSNLTVECNYSSTAGLANVSFNVWNSSSLAYTSNVSVSGITNSSSFVYNFTGEGNYSWGCSVVNSFGLVKFSSNFTVSYDLTPPRLTIVSPINLSYYNAGRFNVSLNENGSCRYSLDRGINNVSMTSVNGLVFSSINSSLLAGEYNVSYYCNDSAGNTNSTSSAFYVDLTSPNVTINSPASGYGATGTQIILFDYNVTDSQNISSCSLIMNNALVASNSSSIVSGENNISYSVSSGSYNWQINCTDIAGNIGNSSSMSLTINSESTAPSSGGGGGGSGGGGSSGTTYSLTEQQAESGDSKKLSEKDKIKFELDNNGKNEPHMILTNKVYSDRVDLTISSDPINVSLLVAEEKKISLVSGFYNLYVKLNSINEGKANLTMRTINEAISASVPILEENNASVDSGVVQTSAQTMEIPINFGKIIGSFGIVLIVAVIVVVLWLVFGRRKRKKRMRQLKIK